MAGVVSAHVAEGPQRPASDFKEQTNALGIKVSGL